MLFWIQPLILDIFILRWCWERWFGHGKPFLLTIHYVLSIRLFWCDWLIYFFVCVFLSFWSATSADLFSQSTPTPQNTPHNPNSNLLYLIHASIILLQITSRSIPSSLLFPAAETRSAPQTHKAQGIHISSTLSRYRIVHNVGSPMVSDMVKSHRRRGDLKDEQTQNIKADRGLVEQTGSKRKVTKYRRESTRRISDVQYKLE
jgi:hypothetical protein